MIFNSYWNTPNKIPSLLQDEVHVWCFSLDLPSDKIKHLYSFLAEKERARAQRFRFDKDRNAYIAARGNLRCILASYLDVQPGEVRFGYNQYGKPECENDPNLQFNISHSTQVALCAVVRNIPVGIDVEYMERECEMDGIAERFFSKRESDELHALHGAQKTQAFFNAWTRKEAFLKAFGQGLSFSLKRVEVSITPEKPAVILALHDEKLNPADWFIQALNPLEHFAAAIVLKGKVEKINTWKWPA